MQAIINRKAGYDYEFLKKYEAGLVLFGHEVKAVKEGRLNLKGSYIKLKLDPRAELFLVKALISPYSKSGKLTDYEPERPRKLLLHKEEIRTLVGKLQEKGLTLVPIKVYNKRNRLKLEFALAKGTKKHEKKAKLKEKDIKRQIQRTLKTQQY